MDSFVPLPQVNVAVNTNTAVDHNSEAMGVMSFWVHEAAF